jgi:hypothetical protein
MLIVSIPLLGLMAAVSGQHLSLIVVLAVLVGVMTGGPANMICSACAADLAADAEEVYHKKAYSTVAGIIDGFGGIGAGIGQAAIGVIAGYSWTGVFVLLMGKAYTGSALASALCLAPIVLKESRRASMSMAYVNTRPPPVLELRASNLAS